MENRFTHYYFIGIGGIGMSALARYLVHIGKTVAGYDKVRSSLCEQLENEGMNIHYKDDFENIPADFKDPETACVIYTPAVPKDFGELLRFRESGITMKKRAELLGDISKTMTCLAVAGTHGKTTTSAILAHLLFKAGVKTTAFCGGIVNEYKTNFIYSGTDVMVVEADEYDRSFMNLDPDIAGITAIDADHLDIYGSEEEFKKTFLDFADLVSAGQLYVNEQVSMIGKKVGIKTGGVQAINLKIEGGAYHFDLKIENEIYNDFIFRTPGRHNLSNALLALAMAVQYGIDPEKLKEPLSTFPGVERRFTYRLSTEDLILIDDYAHHPTEINAVHDAVREMYPDEKISVIFQPHLYSRTRDFMDDFAQTLSRFDKVGLLDIYPAREQPIDGVTSGILVEKIAGLEEELQIDLVAKNEVYAFAKAIPGKILLLLGAGDIGVEIFKLTEQLKANYEK